MKNVIWILSASLLTLSAHADVACEAIKSEQAGKATLRGVRVTNLGKTYVREQLFGDERAALYFGSDTGSRDRAGKLCWEILNATRCDSRTPKTQDQYANHGDPGFGPALWQKDSTKAATLRVEGVSKEVQQYIGKSLETRDGEYFKYYSSMIGSTLRLRSRATSNP
ncbi:MAG: hypothetical protein EBX52_08175 [Proteobacteria bacterium]|nr:hypothetical protein [Pseudomonadota bacterium]